MRRFVTLVAYWVVGTAISIALMGPAEARLLAPLGRVLLLDRQNGWQDLRDRRRWLEAIGLAFVWGWLPWLIDLFVGRRLMEAEATLFWMPGMAPGGSAAWWWAGVGIYFGLLHRSLLAGFTGGVFAMLFQWLLYGWIPGLAVDGLLGMAILVMAMGLSLAVADFLAGAVRTRKIVARMRSTL